MKSELSSWLTLTPIRSIRAPPPKSMIVPKRGLRDVGISLQHRKAGIALIGQINPVLTVSKVNDDVALTADVEHEHVRTQAAPKCIAASAPRDDVIARAAQNDVSTGITPQQVIATITKDPVAPGSTKDNIIA